jgi:hypothetical protein
MIKIFDDVFSLEEIAEIERIVTGVDFAWYMQKSTVIEGYEYKHDWQKDRDRFVDIMWLRHGFIVDGQDNSGYANMSKFIFDKVNKKLEKKHASILRCQANLVLQDQEGKPSTPHIDQEIEHTVMIYYAIDSDGDSVFYDNLGNITNTVSPKKGRVLLFSGDSIHSGTPPKNHKTRIVFNYNLK